MKNEKTSAAMSQSKSGKKSGSNGNGNKQRMNTRQPGATGATGKIKPYAGRGVHDERTIVSYEDEQRNDDDE